MSCFSSDLEINHKEINWRKPASSLWVASGPTRSPCPHTKSRHLLSRPADGYKFWGFLTFFCTLGILYQFGPTPALLAVGFLPRSLFQTLENPKTLPTLISDLLGNGEIADACGLPSSLGRIQSQSVSLGFTDPAPSAPLFCLTPTPQIGKCQIK